MKVTYAQTDDPKAFHYIPTSAVADTIFNIILTTTALGLGVFALSSFLAGGESVARNNAFIAVLAIIGLQITMLVAKVNAWKRIEELFSVWAIEHHGLIPQEYKIESKGNQKFTSMETGETIIKNVTDSSFGIQMKISAFAQVRIEDAISEE